MGNYDLTLKKEVTREFAEVMASIFQLEDINNKNILLEQLKKYFGYQLQKLPAMTMEEVIDFQKVIKFLNEMFKEIDGEQYMKNYLDEELVKELKQEKYNIILEGTIRTAELPIK